MKKYEILKAYSKDWTDCTFDWSYEKIEEFNGTLEEAIKKVLGFFDEMPSVISIYPHQENASIGETKTYEFQGYEIRKKTNRKIGEKWIYNLANEGEKV